MLRIDYILRHDTPSLQAVSVQAPTATDLKNITKGSVLHCVYKTGAGVKGYLMYITKIDVASKSFSYFALDLDTKNINSHGFFSGTSDLFLTSHSSYYKPERIVIEVKHFLSVGLM